jgi:hypothetical protein
MISFAKYSALVFLILVVIGVMDPNTMFYIVETILTTLFTVVINVRGILGK